MDKLEMARKLYIDGKYDKAFSFEYDNIKEYITHYKRDTIPLKILNQNLYEILLQIDIKALSESIYFLISCYEKTNKKVNILDLFDKLKDEIDSEIWKQKIIFYNIFVKAFVFHDDSGAVDDLEKIDNILDIQDVDLLSIYLNLMSGNLPFSEIVEIKEIIVNNTECSTIKLQYQTSLGLDYFLIGDPQKAIIEIEDGLSKFNLKNNQQEDYYTDYILGGSNYFLGFLKKNPDLFISARDHYLKSLSSDKYNVDGKAHLLNLIGDCYYGENNLINAKNYYLKSIELKKSNKVIISLINILKFFGNGTDIKKWDLEIDKENLNESEKYDYLFVRAEIAIEEDDYSSVESIYKEFEQLELKEPYFKELRDKTVKKLMEYCINKNSSTKNETSTFLSKFGKCIILQPNLWGFGFDLKKYFEIKD